MEEAYDQPYKESFEGRVGAYWGLFDASRDQKFSLNEPVTEDPNWPWKAAISHH